MADSAAPVLVGGHPALDLVNSVERGTPVPGRPQVDWLVDWPSVAAWAGRAGILSTGEEAGRGDAARIDGVVELREAAHELCLAVLGGRSWSDDGVERALGVVERRWRAAAPRRRLVPTGRGLAIGAADDPEHRLEDRLADEVVDLLVGEDLGRLKECPVEAGGCGWLFLDRSRNGSRRWCRMADCGTRVKSDRLTERRREQRSQS